MDEIQALKNALQRERAARKQSESILEQKSLELYTINQELEVEVKIRTKDIELLSRFPLENSSPVLRINQELEITFFNKGAEKVISFLNKNEKLKHIIFQDISSVFSSNKTLHKEFFIDQKYYELHFVPIENYNYVNIYGSDITSRKKVEVDLIEARKKAEDSAKVKEQFLANMSHEIRTPIHVILGMASLLQEKLTLTKVQERYIQAIIKSGENLSIIINDILDFSKIEAGKLELEHIHFDLKESINSVVSLFRIKAEEKDLLLETVIDEKLHQYYHSDPYRLNQILLNLVNNSLKFTEFGSIKISVFLSKKEDNVEHVLFSVEDTGIGISQENLSKIFKDFSQVEKSDTRKYGGTGLGLSISKKLVELLGGEIGVKSREGKGTCFYFILPLKKVNQSSIINQEKGEVSFFNNTHVLLVEDNSYNQLLVETIFRDMGIKTTIANHGKEAISLLEKNTYDLIFMDIQMPIMNGIEATNYIRNELKIKIPIIALTANAIKGDKDKYINQGMDAYLSKPFTFLQITQILKKFLPHYQDIPFIEEKIVEQVETELLYDLAYLEDMGIEDPTFISQMVSVFLKDVPKTLMSMYQNYEQQECEQMGYLAHHLLSSCRTFKMDEIVSFLEQIQQEALNENWGLIEESYQKVVPLFDKVLEQLKELE